MQPKPRQSQKGEAAMRELASKVYQSIKAIKAVKWWEWALYKRIVKNFLSDAEILVKKIDFDD